MKIRYISDAGLSEGTINLIKALPYNNKFKESVKSTRDAIGIPLESFCENMEETAIFLRGESLYRDKLMNNKKLLLLGASTLIREFSLPENWVGVVEEILLFGSALLFEEEITLSLPEQITQGAIPFVGVNIYGRISRNKLDKWLDKNWGAIEYYFEALKFKKPNKIHRKLVSLKTEVMALYESGKSLDDISRELGEKYDEKDKKVADLVADKELLGKWIERIKSDIET